MNSFRRKKPIGVVFFLLALLTLMFLYRSLFWETRYDDIPISSQEPTSVADLAPASGSDNQAAETTAKPAEPAPEPIESDPGPTEPEPAPETAPEPEPSLETREVLLAQCLADKGAVMHGAHWCGYREKQKKEFGSAFQYIEYVECTEEPELCSIKGVEGYPSWVLSDGSVLAGYYSLVDLAALVDCPY